MNTLDRAASRTFMQRRVLAPTSVSHVVVLLDSSIVNVALNLIPAASGPILRVCNGRWTPMAWRSSVRC